MQNPTSISECPSCKSLFLANGSSKGFTTPSGRRICFNCFINSSINNSEKDEEESPSPLLCSSILVGSPCTKESLVLHKINFNLEPCRKHIWTELKSQKLHAYTYCTVCDVCLCSVCLLSTPHRYHETVQLSDLFTSIDDVPNQSSPVIKPSIEKGTLGKVAQRVITLLSTPPQLLPEGLGSTARQQSSSLNNTSEGKSLFLLDVLNKDPKRSPRSNEPQINGFTVEESGQQGQPITLKNSTLRRRSPLTVNTSIYNGNKNLQKSQRKFNMMSPIVKFKKPILNSPPNIENIREVEQPEEDLNSNFTIYKPNGAQKIKKGHTKTASLVPEILKKTVENKENRHPDQQGTISGAKKLIKRVVSSTKTRCETPRQSSALSTFTRGLQQAFGNQKPNQSGKSLILSRLGISAANLGELLELAGSYKIAELDLRHNSLTDGCLPALATLLQTQAAKVDLRGNLLTRHAVALFRQACPRCAVVDG
jgi:hypothetical protein